MVKFNAEDIRAADKNTAPAYAARDLEHTMLPEHTNTTVRSVKRLEAVSTAEKNCKRRKQYYLGNGRRQPPITELLRNY
jgi:hypothetical protein